jgi:hypothetical protein
MTIKDFSTKLRKKIWKNIRDFFPLQITNEAVLVRNINYDPIPFQKKLLISYVTYGYFTNFEDYSGRTLLYEISKIIKVFSELGYCIDLINHNDLNSLEIIKNRKYDVIFGFGEVFYLMAKLHTEAITILYMTEQHPEFSYQEEKKRIDYFHFRHKKLIPITRSGQFYKLKHFEKKYSEVITLSEIEPLKKQYNRPFNIYPTGLINEKFIFKDKNHINTRKNFLWFGSTGAIHKGLDLLIDVFSKKEDIYLHICGFNETDRKILKIPKRQNIIDYGSVDVRSQVFLDIMEKCSYSILPSCSEGFSTSITTCMLHGLIPVVVKNTGFNRLGDKAIFLEEYKIEYIQLILTKLADENPEALSLFSRQVFDFARREFLNSTFESKFKIIINNILKLKNENSSSAKTFTNVR